jgi:hypothetical protein
VRRGCLFGITGILGLCIASCVISYFIGLPRLHDRIREPIDDAVTTEISRQIQPIPNATVAPGTYVIRDDQLNAGLGSYVDLRGGFKNVIVTFAPAGFEINFTSDRQNVTYRGDIEAVDGQVRVTNMTDHGWLTYILPKGEIRKALENQINKYLAANGLRVSSAQLGDGRLTLVTTSR